MLAAGKRSPVVNEVNWVYGTDRLMSTVLVDGIAAVVVIDPVDPLPPDTV